MSATATTSTGSAPKSPKPPVLNRLGLEMSVYKGLESTLCAGCGHDSITNSIVKSLFELGVEPYKVAKLSGIGCSSKTTAYFLNQSHGFNAVHGRMAPIATGAGLANRQLINIGVSGDGDTASIGLGNFLHMIRRNVPVIYIIEDNGCYGLTKGQFSATADEGSKLKTGGTNELPAIDCCSLAIELGCGYVARSFSGDFKQVQALIKGAISHRGAALLDIISPCITFNDHEGSTRSYRYVKEHKDAVHEIGFVPYFDEITVDYDPGTTQIVEMPDGSKITLTKLDTDYDPTDRNRAMELIYNNHMAAEPTFSTGLLYYNGSLKPIDEQLNMVEEPLATLPEERVRPDDAALAEIMESLR